MTPVTLDDRRHRNGTTTTVQQPYFLHAQWHEISTTVEKKMATMALIVVYRYDVYYVPWSSKLTDTDKRNVTVVTRTADAAKTSRAPSSATPSAAVDDDDDDENSNESENNATVSPKLSWEPWPHGLVRRITTSGSGASVSDVGEVSNGVADYLYESERDKTIQI